MKKYIIPVLIVIVILLSYQTFRSIFNSRSSVVEPSNLGASATTVTCSNLNTPVLVASSTTAGQYIAAGSTGIADAAKFTYKFTFGNNGCTIAGIKELKFSATNATSVKVGGISAPVISGVAYLAGLSLTVPAGSSNLNVDVYVSYPAVGSGGVASNSTSQIALTYVKYWATAKSGNNYAGSNIITAITPSISAPMMMLVNSKPAITVSQSGNSVLAVGSNEVIDATVTADTHGSIKLNSLPIKLSVIGATLSNSSIIVKDSSNSVVATTNTSVTSGNPVISFSKGYALTAGKSQTFKVYISIASINKTGAASLAASLGDSSNFSWSDSTGKVMTGNNKTYLYNYPTNSSAIYKK
ncbi:MAG TPA: hypothetical protein VMR49_00855 [Candidatus Paceibacterota bacterium]|nr:hypothetical protein [Candidatus Paceibacterota bacterium]